MSLYHDTATDPLDVDEIFVKHSDAEVLNPDYVIRNNELVWAKPNMYLTGPVNYEVVGSPTITDGVASGFSGTDALLLTNNLDIKDGLEAVFKVHTASTLPDTNQYIFVYNPGNNSVSQPLGLWLGTSGKVAFSTRYGGIVSASALNNDTDYYLKVISSNGVYELLYGTDGVNYTSIGTKTDTDAAMTNHIELGAWTFSSASLYRPLKGSIDLNESYIKLNNQLWFYGKNYATQNIAPVPSGYTYGTTTTSAIGYVDMRTQTFTAAPTGAILGRDE